MIIETKNIQETQNFARAMGESFLGSEVVELVGDVGAGKTTFTKGLAKGLGIDDPIQSPSFTISQTYSARDGLTLVHYDFYRLSDPGIMANELAEVIADKKTITVVEWADTVSDILPKNRKKIIISATSEEGRKLEVL